MLTRFWLGIASLTAGPFPPTGTPYLPERAWGFQLTTGIVSGSDSYPPVGASTPFFFSTSGADRVTPSGQVRNLVLVGGGITQFQRTNQFMYRFQRLEIAMVVPEPAQAGRLAAGLLGLLALAWLRRRRGADAAHRAELGPGVRANRSDRSHPRSSPAR